MSAEPKLSGLSRKLVNDGLLDEEKAITALKSAHDEKISFTQYLVNNNVLSANKIAMEASNEFGMPVFDLKALDPESVPRHRAVMVGVKLTTMDLVKKGAEFSRVRGVVSVSVVTGRFDLILIVLLKEGFGLLEFYTEEVSKIKGVQSVETFVVYKSYNLKVPYILE